MKSFYAAIIVGSALAFFLEVVVGYTSAIEIPKIIFSSLGAENGLLLAGIFTVTIPYFLVSILVIPFLECFARSKTPAYSIVTMMTLAGIIAWKSNGNSALMNHYWPSIPVALGLLSILLAAWLVTKHKVHT